MWVVRLEKLRTTDFKDVTKRWQSDLKNKQNKMAILKAKERTEPEEIDTNGIFKGTELYSRMAKCAEGPSDVHSYTCPLADSDLDSDDVTDPEDTGNGESIQTKTSSPSVRPDLSQPYAIDLNERKLAVTQTPMDGHVPDDCDDVTPEKNKAGIDIKTRKLCTPAPKRVLMMRQDIHQLPNPHTSQTPITGQSSGSCSESQQKEKEQDDGFDHGRAPCVVPQEHIPRRRRRRRMRMMEISIRRHWDYNLEKAEREMKRKKLSQFKPGGTRSRHCGDCKGCAILRDCGQCIYCLDKRKFGGPDTRRQCCIHRRCERIEKGKIGRVYNYKPIARSKKGMWEIPPNSEALYETTEKTEALQCASATSTSPTAKQRDRGSMERCYPLCKKIGLDLDKRKPGIKVKLDLKLLTGAVVYELHKYILKKIHYASSLHIDDRIHDVDNPASDSDRYASALYKILYYNFDISSQNYRRREFAFQTAHKVKVMANSPRCPEREDGVFKLPFVSSSEDRCVRVMRCHSRSNRVSFLDEGKSLVKTEEETESEGDGTFIYEDPGLIEAVPLEAATIVQINGSPVRVGILQENGSLHMDFKEEDYYPHYGGIKPGANAEDMGYLAPCAAWAIWQDPESDETSFMPQNRPADIYVHPGGSDLQHGDHLKEHVDVQEEDDYGDVIVGVII